MTWVKLDDQTPDQPEVAALSDAAFRLHLTALCYCSRHLTDGGVPDAMIGRWGVRGAQRAANELVEAGLWRWVAGDWLIVGYLDHQRSKAQVEAISAKRAEAGTKGGKAKAKAKQTSGNLPPRGQRDRATDTETDDDAVDPGPPTADPSSSSSGDLRAVWIAYANLVAESQAEPPAKLSAFLTSVAKKAQRERGRRLEEYRRICPLASTETLAAWLFDDVDPVMIDRPELDDDFTPAADLKVVGQ